MPTYFKPLRRKIGVIALVMACVFAGGWVRSLKTRDNLVFPRPKIQHAMASAAGVLRWTKYVNVGKPIFGANSEPVGDREDHDSFWKNRTVHWRWGALGFDFGSATDADGNLAKQHEMVRWAIPYWSIVIPLTAISIWLLLSKPPAKLEPKTTPVSENT